MKLGKLIQSVLIGIAIIATFYAFSEGVNLFNNLNVKKSILKIIFQKIRRYVILSWMNPK